MVGSDCRALSSVMWEHRLVRALYSPALPWPATRAQLQSRSLLAFVRTLHNMCTLYTSPCIYYTVIAPPSHSLNTLGQASLRAHHSLRFPLCLTAVQTLAEFGIGRKFGIPSRLLQTCCGARAAMTMSGASAMTMTNATTMTSGEDGSRRGCARRG